MSHAPRTEEVAPTPPAIRYFLGGLLAFAALNAFGGGYYGMSGARGVPTAWLDGSPFASYFIPSLILFVVVGGAFVVAAVGVLARWRRARGAAIAAGLVALGWIAAQLAIIGYVSWLQPAVGALGVLILRLATLVGR